MIRLVINVRKCDIFSVNGSEGDTFVLKCDITWETIRDTRRYLMITGDLGNTGDTYDSWGVMWPPSRWKTKTMAGSNNASENSNAQSQDVSRGRAALNV